MILENYVVSLENILVILNEINIMATKFLDNTDNLFYSDIIDFINFDNKFDNIRIHDLVSKYFVRIISDRITQDLSNKLVLDNNCIVQITDDYSHKRPIINIWYEFTYKDIDCLKHEGDSIKLGVQIEENDYRHIFEIKSKDNILRKSFIDTVSNQDLFPWLHKFEKKKDKTNDDAVLYSYKTDYYDFKYSKSINICKNNYNELLRSIKESLQTGYYDFKKINF
jgi:hypothetical protein